MERRRLGSTELEVSHLGLGCQSLGGGLYYRDDREAVRLLHRAADAGINFFDTADHYGLGESESLIGKAFRERRNTVVLSTKIGTTYSPIAVMALRARPLLRPFSRRLRGMKVRLHQLRAAQRSYDFSPAYLQRAVDASLRRLGTDYLDLLLLHKPPAEELERGDCLDALARLQSAGKVRYYGVSCDGVADADIALRHPQVSAIQITVSLLEQAALPEILPRAKAANCGVIARNPRGQGHLTDAFADIMAETYVADSSEDRLRRLAARRFGFLVDERRTLAQAAIKFVQQFDAISVVIPRAVNVQQLNEILGSLEAPSLTPEDLVRIEAVAEETRSLLKSHPYRRTRSA
jgi:aryl-alcohol dehydrogenase-like predicted oxidoreductase